HVIRHKRESGADFLVVVDEDRTDCAGSIGDEEAEKNESPLDESFTHSSPSTSGPEGAEKSEDDDEDDKAMHYDDYHDLSDNTGCVAQEKTGRTERIKTGEKRPARPHSNDETAKNLKAIQRDHSYANAFNNFAYEEDEVMYFAYTEDEILEAPLNSIGMDYFTTPGCITRNIAWCIDNGISPEKIAHSAPPAKKSVDELYSQMMRRSDHNGWL
ncbi:hypothetical protein PENTCL1PPCAC_13961, partial [Pristionchus entomophagus]